MNYLKAILVMLFLLFVVIVAVQNYQPFSTGIKFRIDLIFFKYETSEMSLYFVTIISFLVGIVLAALCGIFERFHLKKQIKTLMRNIKEKDEELSSLRNLPVTAEDISLEQTSDT
jgi:uncharacterized integral membrane protein